MTKLSKKEIQAQEDKLIDSFRRDVGNKSSANSYVHAILAAATPLFVFIRIQQVDVSSSWHVMTVLTCVAAYVIQFAYGKGKYNLKSKTAALIHEGVTQEVMGSMTEVERKKISSGSKNEKIVKRKNDISDDVATKQTIFQTNIVFFVLVLLMSFGFFGKWEPLWNFIGSMAVSSGLIWLLAAMDK